MKGRLRNSDCAHEFEQDVCRRCGQLTREGNRQRIWTKRVRALLAADVTRVPCPPNYSTPAAVSARCREAGTSATRLSAKGLYFYFIRAVRAAKKDART